MTERIYGAITLILMIGSLALVAFVALWASGQFLLGLVTGFCAALGVGAWAATSEEFD